MIEKYFIFIEFVNKKCNLGIITRLLNISRHKVIACINEIELELGTNLFIKNTKPMKLTPTGERIYNQYCDIYELHLSNLEISKNKFSYQPINLMIDSKMLTMLFHTNFLEFMEEHNDIMINFYPFQINSMLETMDIILADYKPSPHRYNIQELYRFKSGLFCKHDYQDQYGKIITPQDLITHKHRICLYRSMLKNGILKITDIRNNQDVIIDMGDVAIFFETSAYSFHQFSTTDFIYLLDSDSNFTESLNNVVQILPNYQLPEISNYISVSKSSQQSRPEIRKFSDFLRNINFNYINYQ